MNKSKRILIKLSGEALEGPGEGCVSSMALEKIALHLQELLTAGFQVGVVLGGGNFFRGLEGQKSLPLRRIQADQVGMLATLMNGLILSEVLHKYGVAHKVLSAVASEFVESYTYAKMQSSLESGELIIFVGGTSHPYFTTDTAAALRASEMGATLLLKATTKVDGIYNKDPRKEADAIKYSKISYKKALDEKLQVLDLTAFTLCMENKIEIRVYKYNECSFLEVLQSNDYGSLVTEG